MLEPKELVLVPSGISFILGGRIAFAFDRISHIMLWAWYEWEAWTITDITRAPRALVYIWHWLKSLDRLPGKRRHDESRLTWV